MNIKVVVVESIQIVLGVILVSITIVVVVKITVVV